jgi:hypothetical protein
MKINNKDLGFILYNNRSKSVVDNFIPDNLNIYRIRNIENIFEKSKSKFTDDKKMVVIPIEDLNINEPDFIIERSDLQNLKYIFDDNKGKFSKRELDFLTKRGINEKVIEKWNLLGLSNFKGDELKIIGATVHPIISNILEDGIEGGGIVFPLFKNGKLINNAIRKISLENKDKASLKYSLACPDVPVWKSDDIKENEEIWLTEGLFDMFSLDNIGLKAVSCSSAMWSSIQLHQIIELKPSKINIFSDNDEVGIRTSAVLKDFFNTYGIDCDVYKSIQSKDAAQHFFEHKLSINELIKMENIEEEVNSKDDDSFNFISYLKNRRY